MIDSRCDFIRMRETDLENFHFFVIKSTESKYLPPTLLVSSAAFVGGLLLNVGGVGLINYDNTHKWWF